MLFLFIAFLELNFNILKSSYMLVDIEGGNETKVNVAGKILITMPAVIRNQN